MSHNNHLIIKTINNNNGFGLVAAIFVVVILAVFGLLVARFTGTGSLESAEDYLWAQAYYSAQSGIQLCILQQDLSGGVGGCAYPTISQFTLQQEPPTLFQIPTQPSVLRVSASRASAYGNVERILEAKYIL